MTVPAGSRVGVRDRRNEKCAEELAGHILRETDADIARIPRHARPISGMRIGRDRDSRLTKHREHVKRIDEVLSRQPCLLFGSERLDLRPVFKARVPVDQRRGTGNLVAFALIFLLFPVGLRTVGWRRSIRQSGSLRGRICLGWRIRRSLGICLRGRSGLNWRRGLSRRSSRLGRSLRIGNGFRRLSERRAALRAHKSDQARQQRGLDRQTNPHPCFTISHQPHGKQLPFANADSTAESGKRSPESAPECSP